MKLTGLPPLAAPAALLLSVAVAAIRVGSRDLCKGLLYTTLDRADNKQHRERCAPKAAAVEA